MSRSAVQTELAVETATMPNWMHWGAVLIATPSVWQAVVEVSEIRIIPGVAEPASLTTMARPRLKYTKFHGLGVAAL